MTTPQDNEHEHPPHDELDELEQPESLPRLEQTHEQEQAPGAQAPQAHLAQPPAPVNPATVPLKAMFPDFDNAVLQSVLESVYGNQDAAVDLLLGMSDPSYVSTHHTQQEVRVLSSNM